MGGGLGQLGLVPCSPAAHLRVTSKEQLLALTLVRKFARSPKRLHRAWVNRYRMITQARPFQSSIHLKPRCHQCT